MTPVGRRGRLAVVSATAGTTVGGAETVLRETAEGLAARGWEVDLLTSAAESIYTWENVVPEGTTVEGDLTVRRFAAAGLTQPDHDRVGARILAGRSLDVSAEYGWVNTGMRMPGLFEYLDDHAGEYRAIICGPYMFWAALVLADLAPERTILMPCLHDEPFARLDVYRYQLTNVRGLWFLSEPEQALATQLGLVNRCAAVVGSAIDAPAGVDPEGFRRRFGVDGDFLFYAGRREWGKGWPQLLDDLAFAASLLGPLPPLVTCGVGEVGAVPPGVRVVDLGLLPDAARSAGQAAATAYIQPSAMESLSRTVLEAFALETPVIANAASAVVRWHCVRSGAGLTYANRFELVECLRLMREQPETLLALGQRGPEYVRRHFTWPAVLDRAERTIEEWC